MVEKVDEGEIVSQSKINIDEGDTVEILYEKLYQVTPCLLITTLKRLEK
jgi:methionyl-tRNA formyltransferase